MSIRASDEDRQRTVAALEHHTGAGRLTLDEFAERARLAHDARTLDDLAEAIRDLPAEAPAPDAPRSDLVLIFAIAAAALVLLGLFIAVSR